MLACSVMQSVRKQKNARISNGRYKHMLNIVPKYFGSSMWDAHWSSENYNWVAPYSFHNLLNNSYNQQYQQAFTHSRAKPSPLFLHLSWSCNNCSQVTPANSPISSAHLAFCCPLSSSPSLVIQTANDGEIQKLLMYLGGLIIPGNSNLLFTAHSGAVLGRKQLFRCWKISLRL